MLIAATPKNTPLETSTAKKPQRSSVLRTPNWNLPPRNQAQFRAACGNLRFLLVNEIIREVGRKA